MMEIPESTLTIGTLIPLLSIFMGGLVVLVPVIGVTARFALKPAVEALAALQALHATMDQAGRASRQVEEPSRTVKQLEEQLLDSRLLVRSQRTRRHKTKLRPPRHCASTQRT